jgi:hypothetical protein
MPAGVPPPHLTLFLGFVFLPQYGAFVPVKTSSLMHFSLTTDNSVVKCSTRILSVTMLLFGYQQKEQNAL